MNYRYLVYLLVHGLLIAQQFPVKIVNTNINQRQIKNVYVVVKGLNPKTKKQCFVRFTPGTEKIGVLEDITPNSKSINYAMDITQFPNNIMYLPNIISGRIYISINHKLVMPIVGKAPNLGIADPSPYNKTDPNYQFLYDKVELTYTGNTTVINPTAVDFIGLPITITQQGETFGIQKPLLIVQDAIKQAFNKVPSKATWYKLIEKNKDGTILRILAPGRDDNYFDKNYLTGKNFNYINELWNYYEEKKLNSISVDCSELKKILPNLGNYTFNGQVKNNVFVFTNGRMSVSINKPTSNQFFLAAQGPFEAKNNTPKAIIVRDLTAAWSVGFLPAADKTVLSKNYFVKNKARYYTINKRLPLKGQQTGPWYNLYAKLIHQQSVDMYAWPYDDVLGIDGTNTSKDAYMATLTLGDITNINIP